MKMNPEIKAEWVKRLRSGGYRQTQGLLRNSEGYCCLGVLGEVAVEKGVAYWSNPYKKSCWQLVDIGQNSNNRDETVLPLEVWKWAGLTDEAGALPGHAPASCLTECNDEKMMTFDEIANIIEEWL